MLGIETKEKIILLTDFSAVVSLRRYVDQNEKKFKGLLSGMSDDIREGINLKTVEKAIQLGSVPVEWQDRIKEAVREFVRDGILPEWVRAMEAGSRGIVREINLLQRKQFEFNPTSQEVQNWVDERGGTLIVEISTDQWKAINAVLAQYTIQEPLSPYQLLKKIKPLIGLTERETLAVMRFEAALREEGLSPAIIQKQVERYASYLHENRAYRIARTELSFAYNRGQLEAVRQAIESGWLPGQAKKVWLTAPDDRLCDICESLDGEERDLDEPFSIGEDAPPAHPNCRCSVSYQVRRE